MAASKSISRGFEVLKDPAEDGIGRESGEHDRTSASFFQQFMDVGHFLRTMRIKRQFGHLSRAPLKLLRLELCGNTAECDWVARPPDAWDADLPRAVGDRHASLQALEDAIAVRDLLFSSLLQVDTAAVRAFRESGHAERELIIVGTVTREPMGQSIHSLTMRAKLLGFQFWLEDGVLGGLQPQECVLSF